MKKFLYTILIILIIVFIILIYARFIGPLGLKTKEISYNTEYISESYDGLKIVQSFAIMRKELK